MREFLNWYNYLSQSKSFRWAKFWGLILALLLAGIGYFWWQGHGFEATLILGMPVLFAASNALESLNLAFQYATFMGLYTARQEAQTATANWPLVEAQPQTANGGAQPQTEPQNLLEQMTDSDRLGLCQQYVFLYLVFELRVVGEETHQRMTGIAAGKYRNFMAGLKMVGLVSTTPGKAEIAQINLETALQKLVEYDELPFAVWDFPIAVYQDDRNWKEYDPTQLEMEPGRAARLNSKRYQGKTTPLLPIYPTTLNDLKLN
jgi:hypothetical protein